MFDSLEEELEDEPTAPAPVPLSFPKFKISERKLNPKVVLADEIYKLWGIVFPHTMKLMEWKGIDFVREQFEQVKKASCRNPKALFLWRVSNVKPELKDVP